MNKFGAVQVVELRRSKLPLRQVLLGLFIIVQNCRTEATNLR